MPYPPPLTASACWVAITSTRFSRKRTAVLKSISTSILKLFGWQVENKLPTHSKYIIIGAPHTSNWDFPLTLLALSAMGLRFSWVAKHTLFRQPLGFFFRRIGGIPVNRKVRHRFIYEIVGLFRERNNMVLALAPEGTRSKTRYWKDGFYLIATEAGVPIALGYIDYPTKRIGVGLTFQPSGDIEKDFPIIQDFYKGKVGKYPDKQGDVQLKTRKRK